MFTLLYVQHDLGVPSVSLNVLTGHRSCAPEDYGAPLAITPQGPAPVSGVFPAGVKVAPSGDWVSSNSTFTVSRGSPGTPSRTPGHDCRFSAMLFSHASFRIPVRHQIQRYLLSSPPASRAI